MVAVGVLILTLGQESLLSLVHCRANYMRLNRLRTGYMGLDWAFHTTAVCITSWSTFHIADLNRGWGFTLHVGNLRLALALALSTGDLRLAWSLALHLGGLGLTWSLVFHLGNLNGGWCGAFHNLHLRRGLSHYLPLGTSGLRGAKRGTLHTALGEQQATLNLLPVTHRSDAGG